jgi:GDP-L-fucose synthase
MSEAFNIESGKHYVAGHRGMVGAAIVRALQQAGARHIVHKTSNELDLRDGLAVHRFFEAERPDYVFLAAAKVGGIWANSTYPAEFIYDNLQIQNNVIEASRRFGVRKLLFLGSSCIYPKLAPQPLKEEYLMTGPLEPTNEPYAMAKLAGMSMVRAYRQQYGSDFISVLPCNLYGPGDNYHPKQSHVMAALLRKFSEAVRQGSAEVEVWGTGSPLREFMHCDDLASACLFLMEHYSSEEPVNIGTGTEISIRDLAKKIAEVTGFQGKLVFNPEYPDGTPRKVMDSTRLMEMGWRAKVELGLGIRETLGGLSSDDF